MGSRDRARTGADRRRRARTARWPTGSGSWLLVDDARRSTAVSVGAEPGGAPAGVVWIGGGPDAFAAVLEDQIARRRRGELPIVVEDPQWSLAIAGVDPLLERAHESLLTLADGRLGTRGSVLAEHRGDPTVLLSGVYTSAGAETHLLAAPRWNTIALDRPLPGDVRRVLDLHAGMLHQRIGFEDSRLDALLLSSIVRPATAVLRVRDRGRSIGFAPSLKRAPKNRVRGGRDRRLLVDAGEGTPGVDRRCRARSPARHRFGPCPRSHCRIRGRRAHRR